MLGKNQSNRLHSVKKKEPVANVLQLGIVKIQKGIQKGKKRVVQFNPAFRLHELIKRGTIVSEEEDETSSNDESDSI